MVVRIYTTNIVAMELKDYEWRTSDASRSNFQQEEVYDDRGTSSLPMLPEQHPTLFDGSPFR